MRSGELRFDINQEITIVPLSHSGRIKAVYICQEGIKYLVRYLWDGVMQECYFYEDELNDQKGAEDER